MTALQKLSDFCNLSGRALAKPLDVAQATPTERTQMSMTPSLITPFKINISDVAVRNLKSRLKDTVMPSEVDGGFSMGPNNEYISGLIGHLLGNYDWRAEEAKINAFPQFKTEIDGQ